MDPLVPQTAEQRKAEERSAELALRERAEVTEQVRRLLTLAGTNVSDPCLLAAEVRKAGEGYEGFARDLEEIKEVALKAGHTATALGVMKLKRQIENDAAAIQQRNIDRFIESMTTEQMAGLAEKLLAAKRRQLDGSGDGASDSGG